MSLNYNKETDSYWIDPRTPEEKDWEHVEYMMKEPKYANHLNTLNLMLTLIKESMDTTKTKHEKNKIKAQIDFLDWEIELALCCDRRNQDYPNEVRQNMQECKLRVAKHLDRISTSQRKEPLRNCIKKLIEEFADEKKVGFGHANKPITDLLMKATFDVLDRKDPNESVKALLKAMTINFPELKDPNSMYETCGLYTKLQYRNGYESWSCDSLISRSTLPNIDKIRTRENPCLNNRDYEEVLSVCIHLLVSKIFPTEISDNHELRNALYDYSDLRNFLGENEEI